MGCFASTPTRDPNEGEWSTGTPPVVAHVKPLLPAVDGAKVVLHHEGRQVGIQYPEGERLLRTRVPLSGAAWDGRALWGVGANDDQLYRMNPPATGGDAGPARLEALPAIASRCLGFAWRGTQPVLKVLDRWGRTAVLARTPGGGWWHPGAKQSRTVGASRAGAAWRLKSWGDGRLQLVDSRAQARRAPVDVPGLFSSVQPAALRKKLCALQHEEGSECTSRIVLLQHDGAITNRFAQAASTAPSLQQEPVSISSVGPAREYRCVSADERGGFFAALQDGSVLELDRTGDEMAKLPPPSDAFRGYELQDLVACLIDGRHALVARMSARRESPAEDVPQFLCIRDAGAEHGWKRLEPPGNVGDGGHSGHCGHFAPAAWASLVHTEPSARGELAAWFRSPGAPQPVRHVYSDGAWKPLTEDESLDYKPPKASGLRFFVKGKRIEAGPGIGQPSPTSSTLGDVFDAARRTAKLPWDLSIKAGKAFGQKRHGRQGLKNQGFYDQVGAASNLLVKHLSGLAGGPVAGGGLGALLDGVQPSELQKAMRDEEAKVLEDLHDAVALIPLVLDRPEAGFPAQGRKADSPRVPKDRDVMARLHAYIGSYAAQRGGKGPAPPVLESLMRRVQRLALSRQPLVLPFPDPAHPRAGGDVGLLVARLGLGLQRLQHLEKLASKPDAAAFKRSQDEWHAAPVRRYATGPAASTKDVEAIYGIVKSMRNGLTNPRSPAFQAVARSFGVKTPAELREALTVHVRSMGPMDLVRLTDTLAAGPSGALGLPGGVAYITLSADRRQVKEHEFKPPSKEGGQYRFIATTRRGRRVSAGLSLRPPLPFHIGLEVQPVNLSFLRLPGQGGLHALIPEKNIVAFLTELLTPGEVDLPRLFDLCDATEQANYSEAAWALTSSVMVGHRFYDNVAREDKAGEYLLAGLELVATMAGRAEQRLETLDGASGKRTLEKQTRDLRSGFSAMLGLVRTSTMARGGWAVKPQGQTGSLVGYVFSHPRERNEKVTLHVRQPDAVAPGEWQQVFADAAALLPAQAEHVRELRLRWQEGDAAAVPRLRALVADLATPCPVDEQTGDSAAARETLLDAIDLLALQDDCHRNGRAMAVASSLRYEPRSTDVGLLFKPDLAERIQSGFGRPDPNAAPYRQLREWMKEDPALGQAMRQATQGTGATRFKLRHAMPASRQLELNTLLSRDPAPSLAEVEAFLNDPQHWVLKNVILLRADGTTLGGAGVGFMRTTTLNAEAEIGTITFDHAPGKAVPCAYTLNDRLAEVLERAR
jgi:hypothetical protein